MHACVVGAQGLGPFLRGREGWCSVQEHCWAGDAVAHERLLAAVVYPGCMPMAVSRPRFEAGDVQALPGKVAHAGAALARPSTPAHGSGRAAGKGPPGGGADGDTTLSVRTARSNASAHSWRIEAAGAAGSPPHGSGAAAAAEVARLREELASAHQLHADLELSSGEAMQVLQQQVGFKICADDSNGP